jgi:hypothetical protein
VSNASTDGTIEFRDVPRRQPVETILALAMAAAPLAEALAWWLTGSRHSDRQLAEAA